MKFQKKRTLTLQLKTNKPDVNRLQPKDSTVSTVTQTYHSKEIGIANFLNEFSMSMLSATSSIKQNFKYFSETRIDSKKSKIIH